MFKYTMWKVHYVNYKIWNCAHGQKRLQKEMREQQSLAIAQQTTWKFCWRVKWRWREWYVSFFFYLLCMILRKFSFVYVGRSFEGITIVQPEELFKVLRGYGCQTLGRWFDRLISQCCCSWFVFSCKILIWLPLIFQEEEKVFSDLI